MVKHKLPCGFVGGADKTGMSRSLRLLMLTHRVPFPPDRGDRIRSWHLIEHLRETFDLSLASISDEPIEPWQHEALFKATEQYTIRRVSEKVSKLRGLWGWARGCAITPSCLFREDLAKQIEQWHRDEPFDAVLTFCSGMTDYAKRIFNEQTSSSERPVHVLDLVDLDSAKWASYAEHSRWPMSMLYRSEAKRLSRIEAGEGFPVDWITLVSDREASLYREQIGDTPQLRVVSNGVDSESFVPAEEHLEVETSKPRRLVFVGVMDYKPNVDAVVWFAQNVWPSLRKQCSQNLQFRIVGKRPTAVVRELAELPGVVVTGPVDEVLPELHQASLVVAPLRIARGVQNKVLEAMSAGQAVVASPQAAEGVRALAGSELIVAESAEQWTQEIMRLLESSELRKHIGRAARQRIEKDYAWSVALSPMTQYLSQHFQAYPHPLPTQLGQVA